MAALAGTLLISCGALRSTRTPMGDFSDATSIGSSVNFLSSDALQGRDTGSEGIEKAAAYLEGRLKEYGISPYFKTYRDTLQNTKDIAYNVVGVLEGSHRRLREEFILIGAHYDHIGLVPPKDGDGIANGANDNASGTATVLELARYFGANTPPARSIIFALFSAEERGLLGSKHLAQTLKEKGIDLYAVLNFEMTGVPMEKPYLMYLTGYDQSNLAEVCNAYGGEGLVGKLPKAQEFNLFQRSDNYPFYQEFEVPAHTFSTFDFENFPYYHQPGDEASRMDLDHMAAVVNRILPAVWGIANAQQREIVFR